MFVYLIEGRYNDHGLGTYWAPCLALTTTKTRPYAIYTNKKCAIRDCMKLNEDHFGLYYNVGIYGDVNPTEYRVMRQSTGKGYFDPIVYGNGEDF